MGALVFLYHRNYFLAFVFFPVVLFSCGFFVILFLFFLTIFLFFITLLFFFSIDFIGAGCQNQVCIYVHMSFF